VSAPAHHGKGAPAGGQACSRRLGPR